MARRQAMYYPPYHLVFPKPTQTMTSTENLQEMTIDTTIPRNEWKLSYQLQFKLLSTDAKLPTRGSEHAAGLDLYSRQSQPYGEDMVVHDTGVAVAIPEGYVGLVFPRSSISGTNLRLANCVAVIDSDYRGPILLKFDRMNYTDSERDYEPGDRIGQLLIAPAPQFSPVAVDELPETTRGSGGFGSTGR